MAWTSNPYCTVGDVRALLGFTPGDTSADNADDQWLQVLIGYAQAAIDEELGFTFQQNAGATNVYDGSGDGTLLVDDCLAVTQVLETHYNIFQGSDGIFTSGTTQTTDITADVLLIPLTSQAGYGILLKRKTGLPFEEGVQNYAVTGTWGQPSIPKDLTYATARLAVHFYKLRAADYGMTPADAQYSPGQLRYSSTWPSDVCHVLEQHRQRGFYAR